MVNNEAIYQLMKETDDRSTVEKDIDILLEATHEVIRGRSLEAGMRLNVQKAFNELNALAEKCGTPVIWTEGMSLEDDLESRMKQNLGRYLLDEYGQGN